MFPYDGAKASMRLTAVWVDANRVPRVTWSRAKGSDEAHAAGAEMSVVPPSLRQPDTQVIMSEVFFQYRPAVGYVVTGDLISRTGHSLCRAAFSGCGSATRAQPPNKCLE
jgi:hypothetical protein